MKRESHLFEKIISDENLMAAIDEVNKSHHWRKGHRPNRCTAWVETTKPDRVKELKQIIVEGFVPCPSRKRRRWDPSARKWRDISEPKQWPDQYVHHALIQVLQPSMMKGMDFYCCGSIRGRGPIQEKNAIESWVRYDIKGTKYELCCDIRHFYDSLTQKVVIDRMKELIKDRRTIDLVERITGNGIKIGEYTSQWFANTVLQPMDRMIRESGLCKHYARYMDNLTIFGSNKRKLQQLRRKIEKWLNEHSLELKKDWQIFPLSGRMPDAVGYRYGRDYTLPRKHTFFRTKQAISRYRRRKRRGSRIPVKMALSIVSRLGMLEHCNNAHIYRILFDGEKIEKDLKDIIRESQKEVMKWSTFLEQYKEAVRNLNASKRSETNTQPCMAGS